MTAALLVALGLALLIGGGALMVNGASLAAVRLGWSPMLVGLTIVAFGTSAPELVVSLVAATQGETEIVFGNVIGSNIANLGLVLGLSALLAPLEIHGQIVRRELPLLLAGTAAIAFMAADELLFAKSPEVSRAESVALLMLFLVFLYMTAIELRQSTPQEHGLRSDIRHSALLVQPRKRDWWWLQLGAGIVLMFVGGRLTVDSSVALAQYLDIPTAIIGLFVVAVGTSLPELVTSVIAALRGQSDLAVGNVVGSNIFNGLFVLPASGLLTSIQVPRGGVLDVLVSMGFAVFLVAVFYIGRARMNRSGAALFLLLYSLYCYSRLVD